MHSDVNGKSEGIVTYLALEGRRPLCDFYPGKRFLMVDRIVSERVTEGRQSEWDFYFKAAKSAALSSPPASIP